MKSTGCVISFIVPLHNHVDATRAMFESLQASLPVLLDYEIIFIDDASTDGTGEWLQTIMTERVRSITNTVNAGYARSNNIAARLARGEYLFLINNDLIFSSGWIEPMLKIISDESLCAGIVGNIQSRVNDNSLDHAGITLTPAGKFAHIKTLDESGAVHIRVAAVTGACILIRKSDFQSVGGFDEKFFNGGEDVDLCFKVASMGKYVYLSKNSCILHHVQLSRGASSPQDEVNSRHLFFKHRSKIKQMLECQWAELLKAGPSAYAGITGAPLCLDFAKSRDAPSAIAEHVLLREEFRWARQLDSIEPNANIGQRCTSTGLRYEDRRRWYRPFGTFDIVIAELRSARNFYICGIVTGPASACPAGIGITLKVNDTQQQYFAIQDSRNFNVGIIDPILRSQGLNRFTIQMRKLDRDGQLSDDASDFIAITHIVVDDYKVDVF